MQLQHELQFKHVFKIVTLEHKDKSTPPCRLLYWFLSYIMIGLFVH